MVTSKELKPLMGLSFRNKTTSEEVRFIDFTFTGDMVKIITTGNPIKSTAYDMKVELEKWEVIENSPLLISKPTTQQNIPHMVVANESNINELKDILLSDIRKVRNDPSYVNQAKASIDGVKAFIDLAKIEITLKKDI